MRWISKCDTVSRSWALIYPRRSSRSDVCNSQRSVAQLYKCYAARPYGFQLLSGSTIKPRTGMLIRRPSLFGSGAIADGRIVVGPPAPPRAGSPAR